VILPELKGVDLDQDLFAQNIKSQIFSSVMAQAEEIYSDFLGLLLFGESYLYAFKYLVAPRLSGRRDLRYPDTVVRAKILEAFSIKTGAESVPGYVDEFNSDDPHHQGFTALVCESADEVVQGLLSKLFDRVSATVGNSRILLPSKKALENAASAFRIGVPFDGEACIGDLINAAWRVCMNGDVAIFQRQGSNVVDYVSELVLKSIETYELRKHIANVR
jgi:hypothetical protein